MRRLERHRTTAAEFAKSMNDPGVLPEVDDPTPACLRRYATNGNVHPSVALPFERMRKAAKRTTVISAMIAIVLMFRFFVRPTRYLANSASSGLSPNLKMWARKPRIRTFWNYFPRLLLVFGLLQAGIRRFRRLETRPDSSVGSIPHGVQARSI